MVDKAQSSRCVLFLLSIFRRSQMSWKLHLILSLSFLPILKEHILHVWRAGDTLYRQLRVIRVLSQFIDVLLRARRALWLYNYKAYGNSTLLVLNGALLNSINALLVLNWRYYLISLDPIVKSSAQHQHTSIDTCCDIFTKIIPIRAPFPEKKNKWKTSLKLRPFLFDISCGILPDI